MSYRYLNIQKTTTIDYTQMIVPSTQLHLEAIQKFTKLKKKGTYILYVGSYWQRIYLTFQSIRTLF